MTLAEAIRAASAALIAGGIAADDARAEARILVGAALGVTREEMHMRPARPVRDAEWNALSASVARRARREPLAYILGRREFFGLRFEVTEAVLIPRPETELLVEAALRHIADLPAARVVDVGTGSGAIAVAVAVNAPQAQVWATDISPDALTVAWRNANRHGVKDRVHCVPGDLLGPLADTRQFNVIASNPPYIPPTDIETLDPEIRDWEPRIALGINEDALHFYRRLSSEAPSRLVAGGLLVVEVGQNQADAVRELWQAAGLVKVNTVNDYAGIPRVVEGVKAA